MSPHPAKGLAPFWLKVGSAFALVVALLLGASPASAADNKELEKSVVYLTITWSGFVYVEYDDGTGEWSDRVDAQSSCTGWFVGTSGEIVTAGHCVEPKYGEDALVYNVLAEMDQLNILEAAKKFWIVEGLETGSLVDRIVEVSQPEAVDGAVVTDRTIAQVIDLVPFTEGDMALLKVAGLPEETPPLSVASAPPETGDDLTAIGFPAVVGNVVDSSRVRASFKTGTASSQQIGTNGIAGTEINADISGGMSGGPTVDENGSVLGINSYRLNGETQSFNFITDTTGLRSFLKQNGIEPAEPVAAPVPSTETPGTEAPAKTDVTSASTGGQPPTALLIGIPVVGVLLVASIVAVVLIARKRKPAYAQSLAAFSSQPEPPICPDCGQTNPVGAVFCTRDGTRLITPATRYRPGS